MEPDNQPIHVTLNIIPTRLERRRCSGFAAFPIVLAIVLLGALALTPAGCANTAGGATPPARAGLDYGTVG